MNNIISTLKKKGIILNLEKLFLVLNLLIIFFLWDVKYYLKEININFDPRFLIFFSLIFITAKIKDIKKNFKISFFFTFLITLHLFINIYYEQTKLEEKHFLTIISFFAITIFTLHYQYQIISNIKKLCLIFLFISLTFLIIKNYKFINYEDYFFCGFFKINSKFFKIIFQENSHFGMIAPAIIFYFLTTNKKLYESILLLFFIIISYLYSSTTLIYSLSIIFLIYLIFFFKKKFFAENKLHLFFILVLIILSLTKYACNRKFYEFTKLDFISSKNYNNNINQVEDFINQHFKEKKLNNIEKKELLINRIRPSDVTITSQVFMNSLEIVFFTFSNKRFFGYGMNNYETAFKNSINSREGFYYIQDVKFINTNDGSSSALKLIVEFGFMALIIPIYVIYFFFNKKISTNIKIFLISIILSQSLRGAGYFNGGFLLSIILVISLTHFSRNIKL